MVAQNYFRVTADGQLASLLTAQNPELHAVVVPRGLKPRCQVMNANVTSTNHLVVKNSSDS